MSRKRRKQHETPAPGANPSQEPAGRRPFAARRVAMWSIVLLLPFVLLALVEAGLRLAGFGHDLEPLFMPSPGQPGYLQANPRVVTRFFVDPSEAPQVSIETAYFRARKAPGTFRVFVQGESSAAGFPYGLGASLAGMLDQRLERAFPDREIEVVSTAMAAVNSYALLDFADEILAQEPDAIVVYVGHNEYLGILGVGSTMRMASRPWATRAFLSVREWRLFQLMSRLLHVGGPHSPGAPRESDTLMGRVAGERSIPKGSPLFRQGLEQFESNLGALLAKYRRAGVPVFIGTLASNERDQIPLAVLSGSESDAAGAAKTAYFAAQDAEDLGDFASAREGYAWARDLDPLRFRGPSEFNSSIERLAAAHHATLVDAHGAFVAASPNGLVGSTLMLEHVHPNLDGYFLLADAYFKAMVAQGLPGKPEVNVSAEEARNEIPVSDIDRWLGAYKILRIKSGWPFDSSGSDARLPAPQSEGERLAQELYAQRISWPVAHERLRRYYQETGNQPEYTRVTLILADAFPFTASLQFESAAALIQVGRPLDALRYASRAVELEPDDVNNLLVRAHALLLTGQRDAGRAMLEKVLSLQPDNPTAREVLGELGVRQVP